MSPATAQVFTASTQTAHSIATGKNTNPTAIIKNAPTPDFKIFTQPCTVKNASPSALPTIGTKLLSTNFIVLLFTLSTVAPIKLFVVRSPENIVIENPKTHFITFENNSHKPENLNRGDIAHTTLTVKKIFKSGTKNPDDSCVIMSPKATIIELNATDEIACPDATIIPTITGM